MSSQFKPLSIPPGVVATATKQMSSTNYAAANMVRWVEGQLSPVGGQAKYNYTFASRCKAIHGFYDLSQNYHVAYLCESNLYVDTGGALLDITPVDGIMPPTPPSEGGYGDGLYNDGTYGTPRSIGSDAAIDRVPDAYSLSNFGAVLLAMTSADARLLYWNPADPPGTVAQVVPPKDANSVVPNGRCFVVTPERFVQIFGSYNDGTLDENGDIDGGSFRRFAWCEQEDYTNWNYSDVTTQAGFIDIEPSSPIICAIASRTGTLFFTGKKAYASRYLGTPYVYNYTELGDNCTPWSPQSLATTSSMVLWFSQQGPYSYDGTSILPIQCMVRAWVDDDIDLLNVREQACAVHVANFNEFWWFYPQGPQTNPSGYNTRAVVYNYKEGWWGQAQCARSAGITASYTSHTIMANGLVSYEHEYGNQYNDCDLPWVETFDLNVFGYGANTSPYMVGFTAGSTLTTVKQLLPDIGGNVSNVLYSLYYRNSRSLGTPELQSVPSPVRSDGYVDLRVTGRDLRLRIDFAIPPGQIVNGVASSGAVLPVTVGQHLIDAVPRGDR
jgi:hypothetical protein